MVPTVYLVEWEYLQSCTDLWHPWEADNPAETVELREQVPQGLELVACNGHDRCQRGFRSITCRAFPFFPYFNSQGSFIGLSYYWEYEDRCWVISNLNVVTLDYRVEFIEAYEALFKYLSEDRENFARLSEQMRRVFELEGRAIPLLHRNGYAYKISPRNERTRRVSVDQMPKFAPYKIAVRLPFPDETSA